MCGKLLFEHHERLLPAPMLVYRATLSAIFLACWLNVSIKKTLYEDLSSKALFPLTVRVIAGNLSVFVNFMSVKFFQLTTVAMVINTAPFFTFFGAAIFFKNEKVEFIQTLKLFVGFSGLLMMIFGANTTEKSPAYTPTLIAYIALLFNPLCMSASQVAMRAMRSLNDLVVSTYMVLSYLVVFLPACLIMN